MEEIVADSAEQFYSIPQRPEPPLPGASQSRSQLPKQISKADVYKWVDDKGITHFSDWPADESAEAVELKPLNKLSIPRAEQNRIDSQRRQEVAAYLNQANSTVNVRKASVQKSTGYVLERSSADQHADYVKFTGRFSGGPECRKVNIHIYAHNDQGERIRANTQVKNAGGNSGSWLYEVERRHIWKRTTPRDVWSISRVDFTCVEPI